MVGLGNADNTSDANKPISTATQSALDLKASIVNVDASLNLKANLDSPTLTGIPSAPTAAASTNSTQIATTEFVKTAVANLVASAPATLDTLNELALALGSDASFSTTVSNSIGLKAPIDNPTFTGTVGGITKGMVGLGNADNTSDANKPISTATQSALDLKANLSSVDASLNLKADLASPTFTGTVGGITKSMVGLGNADNTSDANKPISTATQSALDLKASIVNVDASLNLKADIASPTFTGTVSGITKGMVGLGNADNTSDANKPISTATQSALDLKSDIASPTFTGTPNAPTASYDNSSNQLATTGFVQGRISSIINSAPAALDTLNELAAALGNDTNYAATITTALSLKAPLDNPTFSGTVSGITKGMVGLGNADNTSDANKPISTSTQSALDLKASISNVDASLNLKANLASPTFTGTVGGITKGMVGLGNADNTSDANKPISTATQSALDLKASISNVDASLNLKANLDSPTFTGTVSGITKTMVGLGNADNTSDANKPVSTAAQGALDLKADISSPTFTGTPNAPTASYDNSSNQLATTGFVQGRISSIINSAPAALDTLNELAAALGNDANYAATVTTSLGQKAPISNPTFTGTVSGITKDMVGLGNADNTSDANKPVSTATQSALDLKASISNVDASLNLKANLSSPTFTGTVSGITKGMVGLGNVDNTSDANKPVSNATQSALDLKASIDAVDASLNLKANLFSPTFTGTVSGITKGMVGLGNADNTSDANKPVSTATQSALNLKASTDVVDASLNLKANLSSPTFTGTVSGITKGMVGLGNADNTSDANKPVSTATQSALNLKASTDVVDASLNLKANLSSPTFTGTVSGITKSMVGLGNTDNTSDANKPVSTATQSALDLKADIASPTFTGTPNAPTASYDNSSNQLATTGFVQGRISSIINTAPAALDTLNELAAALGNDANYAATVTTALGQKAPISNPTFTGTVSGITKEMVGLGNTDNTSDANKPVSTATQSALDLKASIDVVDASLNLKANLSSPTFTGTVSGITKGMVGLGNVDNTSDANKPVSTATQSAIDLKASIDVVDASLNLKANLSSPTFTGTVSGITKSMVGLGNVDNTSDANKPVSTATQSALNLKASIDTVDASFNLKADLTSPTFTGTVSGITKSMVGLGNADNTSDANKPISTATQSALDLKASLDSPTFTGTPYAPAPAYDNSSNQIATTAFVQSRLSSVINNAPAALDTLNQLTTALNNDTNYATAITNTLSTKANITDVNNDLALKASITYVDASLNLKPNFSQVDASLNLKTDITYVDASLNLKTSFTYVDASLNSKANIAYVDASLNSKANITYVDTSLNLKPNFSQVDASLNLKPSFSQVDTSLNLKTSFTYVDASLNSKANITYVDASLNLKPRFSQVDASLNLKPNFSQVDASLNLKTSFTYVDASLNLKPRFSQVDASLNLKTSFTYVDASLNLKPSFTYVDASLNLKPSFTYVDTSLNTKPNFTYVDASLNTKPNFSQVDASLNLKAALVSPTFTGTPSAPTPSYDNSSNQIATTSFVQSRISTIINSAPAALDTLTQLSAALNNDTDYAVTITNGLSQKANITDVNNALALKANSSNVDVSLNLKSDITYVDSSLTLKPSFAEVDASLNLKPTFEQVDASLNAILNLSALDASFNTKSDITYVDASLNLKSDITYVDASLNLKSDITYVDASLNLKADLASPTFTGTVSGVTKSMVGLSNVDNTSDANKPISTATQSALDLKATITIVDASLNLKADLASPTFTGTPSAPTADATANSTQIATTAFVKSAVASLVASAPATLDTLNELAAALGSDASFSTTVSTALGQKAPIDNPTFTGTVSGITKSMVGLVNVDNTSDANKPVSTAVQSALDLKVSSSVVDTSLNLKANLASPTFTGTVGGITQSMVGLGNVDNTSDTNKPVSTAVQSALDLKATTTNVDASLNLKADLASPTFTGTVSGITQSMVGLGNVDNTSDANKPVSTAVQSALDLKSDITYVDISLNAKPMFSQVDASLNLKANLVSPDLTGTPTAPTASSSTNTTQIATTEFVTSAFNNFKANDVSFNNNVDISGNLVIRGNLSVFQQQSTSIINTSVNNYTVISTQDISLNGNLVVSADVSLNSKLYVGGDASFNGRVDICGNFYAKYPAASIPSSSIDLSVDLSVNGLTIGCGTNDISTNSVVGYNALLSNTTGYQNIAVGYNALNQNTTGYKNIACGYEALLSNTTGYGNAAFGYKALSQNQSGSYTVAVGYNALSSNINGSGNALGFYALNNNTTGIQNNAFGGTALRMNTAGNNNNAFGSGALLYTTSSYNSAFGDDAGFYNKTGSYNTFLGSGTDIDNSANPWSSSSAIGANAKITASNQITLGVAATNVNILGTLNNHTIGRGGGNDQYSTALGVAPLYYNTIGYCNTAIGYYSLLSNTTGYFNSALGYLALRNNTTGDNLTAMGCFALQNNTTAIDNTAFGYSAGINNSTGSFNTFLGSNTNISPTTATWTNSTAIGYNAKITASNQITLGVTGQIVNVPGRVTVTGNVTASAFPTSSDYRIKDYVASLSDCSFTIDKLRPVSYRNTVTDKQDIGLIAHEVQEHFPFLVSGEKDGDEIQSVNYTSLIGLLIHEIQQLKQNQIQPDVIPNLNKRIKELEDRLLVLEK